MIYQTHAFWLAFHEFYMNNPEIDLSIAQAFSDWLAKHSIDQLIHLRNTHYLIANTIEDAIINKQ